LTARINKLVHISNQATRNHNNEHNLIARIGKRYSPELQQNWEDMDVVIDSSEPKKED
jgi:hypothetical protein